MCSTVPLVILCNCVLLFVQGSSSFASNYTTIEKEQSVSENAIELVLVRLDHLQMKLLEMDLELRERDEELQEQSRKILAQQAACANHEQMRKEISHFGATQGTSTNRNLLSTSPYLQGSKRKRSLKSCKEAPGNSSEVNSIQVGDKKELLQVFCEQNSFGGGWLVIQYRFDGSLDFYRNWTEYRNGFGDINREFWIGLEWLHQLTTSRPYELMVELKDFEGNYKFAHYSEFEIGSEWEQYPLKKLGAYNGTAGDSLIGHAGMKFTTKDRDNDEYPENCASTYEGAWWYNACFISNLNGRYMNKKDHKSMNWHRFKQSYAGLAYSRMMIREINNDQ